MAKDPQQQSTSERATGPVAKQKRVLHTRTWRVIGAVVLTIAIVGVAAGAISRTNGTGADDGVAPTTAGGVPANLSGLYNVVIGDPDAPITVKVYEDLQCPFCRRLEAVTGAHTSRAVAEGKVKVDYHLVANLDRLSSTAYSSRALNAAMAVLSTAGPDALMRFRAIAYAGQPAEGGAGEPDSALIDWAVQAGADRATVTPLIDTNAYHQWVVNATNQMSKDGVSLTPSVYIDGTYQGANSAVAAERLLARLRSQPRSSE